MLRLLPLLFFILLMTNSTTVLSYDQTTFEVQSSLVKKGYKPGTPDGLWGNKTAKAVRAFQKDNSLPVTGKMDKVTVKQLGISKQLEISQKTSIKKVKESHKKVKKTAKHEVIQKKVAKKVVKKITELNALETREFLQTLLTSCNVNTAEYNEPKPNKHVKVSRKDRLKFTLSKDSLLVKEDSYRKEVSNIDNFIIMDLKFSIESKVNLKQLSPEIKVADNNMVLSCKSEACFNLTQTNRSGHDFLVNYNTGKDIGGYQYSKKELAILRTEKKTSKEKSYIFCNNKTATKVANAFSHLIKLQTDS